ncbi:MAG: glycine zipper 2TM domain-containing protein [Burkholderiaceae bacterium]
MNTYPLPRPPSRIPTAPSWGYRLRTSKALLPTLAVMAVTVLALTAALVVTRTRAEPDASPYGATATAINSATLNSPQAGSKPQVIKPQVIKPVAVKPVTAQSKPATPPIDRAPAVIAAATCSNCGTVESVIAVQRRGSGSGVGAVAGGVLGGVLGNQVGGGSGRTIATVIGAVGGGYAGNEVEKNVNKKTVYQVSVRMGDGTVRSFEQSSAFAVGSRVLVEGNSLRLNTAERSNG